MLTNISHQYHTNISQTVLEGTNNASVVDASFHHQLLKEFRSIWNTSTHTREIQHIFSVQDVCWVCTKIHPIVLLMFYLNFPLSYVHVHAFSCTKYTGIIQHVFYARNMHQFYTGCMVYLILRQNCTNTKQISVYFSCNPRVCVSAGNEKESVLCGRKWHMTSAFSNSRGCCSRAVAPLRQTDWRHTVTISK